MPYQKVENNWEAKMADKVYTKIFVKTTTMSICILNGLFKETFTWGKPYKRGFENWEHSLAQKRFKDACKRIYLIFVIKLQMCYQTLSKHHLSALVASSVVSLAAAECGRKGV